MRLTGSESDPLHNRGDPWSLRPGGAEVFRDVHVENTESVHYAVSWQQKTSMNTCQQSKDIEAGWRLEHSFNAGRRLKTGGRQQAGNEDKGGRLESVHTRSLLGCVVAMILNTCAICNTEDVCQWYMVCPFKKTNMRELAIAWLLWKVWMMNRYVSHYGYIREPFIDSQEDCVQHIIFNQTILNWDWV